MVAMYDVPQLSITQHSLALDEGTCLATNSDVSLLLGWS